MNEMATNLLVALLRTSLLLAAAALAVQLLLKFASPGSSQTHRAAWLLVLLAGWFWWRLPVVIPYYEPAIVTQAASSAVEGDSPICADTEIGTVPENGTARLADATSPPPLRLPRMAPTPAPLRMARENHAAVPHLVVSPHSAVSHREIAVVDTPRAVEPQPAESWISTARRNWPAATMGGWGAGMFLLAGASIVSYLRFLRCLHTTRPAEEAWTREWDDVLAQHHVHAGVPLWVTANVGPLLCLTPRGYRLVVPAGLWRRLAPAGRLSILRHELAHLRRSDLLKSILVRLLMLPHWFNPLAWLAVRRFDEAAEWACDELAKGADLDGRRAYAGALLQLDAVCKPRPSFHAAASGRGLSVRVQRLLNPQVKEDSLMKKITILAVALGLALLCLVRLDLVAKEPANKNGAGTVSQSKPAEGPTGAATASPQSAAENVPRKGTVPFVLARKSGQSLKTATASVDALRYMPNGCQGIFWADVAALRKSIRPG